MRLILLITLSLFSLVTVAEAPKQQDLQQFFDHYIESYATYLTAGEAADIRQVTRYFHEPTLQVPPKGAPRVANTNSDLDPGLRRFVDALKLKGAVKLEWETRQLVPLTDNKAIAINSARVLDAGGKIIDRRSSVYSLAATDTGWKIVMIQSFPVSNMPTLQ